ncbi:cupin domain-containing protein [Sporosarcina sp. P7]|uniref:CBS domain-containing protein n=1 Tax=Sporosarcina sp. P7 TaxID=2048244 RepID=UPI000C1648EE|nr:cupin domain-containing protein [Sporosarcina sp. P7]PID23310.1 mannose-1-phosphate guanylyltransferase [Sporosarcina sp. P7]
MILDDFLINPTKTIFDGLNRIERNKKGFLIVVNEKLVIQGTVTDGDIRRALLRGITLKDLIQKVMNTNFAYLRNNSSFDNLIEKFKSSKIEFIPIVDQKSKLINLITKKQLHVALLEGVQWDFNFDFLSLDDLSVDYEIYNRPWGIYKTVFLSEYTRAKVIYVNPQEELSLQEHKKREEHWIIIKGEGKVILGESEKQVHEGVYVYIPKGCKHKVINTSKDETLMISEVQLGTYFGEDDIIRFQDKYGRLK